MNSKGRLLATPSHQAESDGYGTQASQLISPRVFRERLKLRSKTRFERAKQLAPLHNIQADAPHWNVVATWETLQQYGVY
jgi:hypothetical protein